MQPLPVDGPAPLEDIAAKALGGSSQGAAGVSGTQPGGDFAARLATQDPAASAPVDGAAPAARVEGAEWLRAPEALESLMQFVANRGAELEPFELIALQMRVHEISFQVETASKAIEHGMHGAKSLLQTQA